jgi:flagellar motor component MotA
MEREPERRIRTDASAPDFRTPNTPEEAIELVTRIAEKVREHGLASLAEDANRADNELMRAGLTGLAAGHAAADIQAATGRALSGAGDLGGGTEVRRIVEAGLLMIRDGQTPDAIRQNLGALRTEDARTARH